MDLNQIVADLGLFLPEIILTGVVLLVVLYDLFQDAEHSIRSGYLAMGGLVLTLLAVLMQDTSAPTGIFSNMLAVDGFSNFLKVIVSIGAILVMWMSFNSNELKGRRVGEYYVLILVLTLGMYFLVSATHLLSIYISLEMVSLMSFLLSGYLKEQMRSNEAAIKYVVFGAFSSGILLYGFSLLYGLTGSTSIFEIQAALAAGNVQPALLLMVLVMVLVGFGYKIAAVPFHFWTPDVYEGAPVPITAFLSVAPKAAGFAIIIRFFNVVFSGDGNPNMEAWSALENLNWQAVISLLAILSMTVGNVIAIQQSNIKRMLAYSSIAHAGYMLLGVVVADQTGIAAILYYAGVYMLMNLGAFFVAIHVKNAFDTEEIEEYKMLGYKAPVLGVIMTIFMFSLTGLPPTGGFIAKFYIFRSLIEYGDMYFWLAIIGLINGVISLYYYMRVVKAMYFGKMELPERIHQAPLNVTVLLVILALPLLLGWMIGDPLSGYAQSAVHFFVN
ncbi:MAG: NADH-quinone oxidoreductase subunit N [Candidatus Marinimicrobia bacterium]|nr:NADH-quinone oxidoreductase subunit N [Candidatus Neomarinimicrobiota bacterium]MCF7850447.1 NADH-quinone oxidoreductase subunit N [Candidatus Neomarinimicrobiota bacterium]MCF7904975.1 NADH-quinone oxidoreductase subunit N [Candidatus Neomarinimicrobiota bacterium]